MRRGISVWGVILATLVVVGVGALSPQDAAMQQTSPSDQMKAGDASRSTLAAPTAELRCSDGDQSNVMAGAGALPSGQSRIAPERAAQIAAALKTGQKLKSIELSASSGVQVYVVRFEAGEVDIDATNGQVTADCSPI